MENLSKKQEAICIECMCDFLYYGYSLKSFTELNDYGKELKNNMDYLKQLWKKAIDKMCKD